MVTTETPSTTEIYTETPRDPHEDMPSEIQEVQPTDDRRTANGRLATEAANIPYDGSFGEFEDYLRGTDPRYTDLELIGMALISKYPELHHLMFCRIGYVWKKKGGMVRGVPKLGQCQKVTGLLRFHSELDFEISVMADNCLGMPNLQLEAVIYHELCHIGWDSEDEKPVLVGHDLEMFYDEVRRYGPWRRAIKQAQDTFRQIPLVPDSQKDQSDPETTEPGS